MTRSGSKRKHKQEPQQAHKAVDADEKHRLEEALEEGLKTAKGELGLDHNETRSWHGWHRHVSLVMLAFAMLTTIRHRANRGRGKNPRSTVPKRIQNLGALVRAGDPQQVMRRGGPQNRIGVDAFLQ